MPAWTKIGIIAPAVFTLAACGSDPAPAPEVEAPPVFMKAGEWTITRNMTGYNTPTVTPAEYQAKVGKTSEEKVCLTVDATGLPAADALAGAEGKDCTYKEKTIHRTRFIATLNCKAGSGTSELALEGNFTADTLTLGTTMTKTVNGSPTLRTTYDLTGKRTGDCTPG